MNVVVLIHAQRKDDEMSVHVDMPTAMQAIDLAIRRGIVRRGDPRPPRRILNLLAKGKIWDAAAAWNEWTDYDEAFLVEEHPVNGYPKRKRRTKTRRAPAKKS